MMVSDIQDLVSGMPGDVSVVVIDPQRPPYANLGPKDVPPDVPPDTLVLWATPLNASIPRPAPTKPADPDDDVPTRPRAEAEIRAILDGVLANGGYTGEDVAACLDRVLDVLAQPSHAVYQAAAQGIPLEMAGGGIHARCAALASVKAHLAAVKTGL